MRLITRCALGAGLAVFGAASIAAATGRDQTTPDVQRKQMLKDGKICTMPSDVIYSLGAFASYKGDRYQCVSVFGENMTPAGSGWVFADK